MLEWLPQLNSGIVFAGLAAAAAVATWRANRRAVRWLDRDEKSKQQVLGDGNGEPTLRTWMSGVNDDLEALGELAAEAKRERLTLAGWQTDHAVEHKNHDQRSERRHKDLQERLDAQREQIDEIRARVKDTDE